RWCGARGGGRSALERRLPGPESSRESGCARRTPRCRPGFPAPTRGGTRGPAAHRIARRRPRIGDRSTPLAPPPSPACPSKGDLVDQPCSRLALLFLTMVESSIPAGRRAIGPGRPTDTRAWPGSSPDEPAESDGVDRGSPAEQLPMEPTDPRDGTLR